MPADILTDRYAIFYGHCLDALGELPTDYCDTVITDPPYHLTSGTEKRDYRRASASAKQREKIKATSGFMGCKWDGGDIAFDPELWAEVLRVAKPGAFLFAFGGTRTWHRLAVAIEDAGWELRDTIMFLHGQGFPKSLDLSKAIDAKLGKKRKKNGVKRSGCRKARNGTELVGSPTIEDAKWQPTTVPASLQAELFDGWGTALKPAWEPIIVAMKPLAGNFASNALRHGVAGLNIDGARVPVFSRPARDGSGNGKPGDGPRVNAYGNGLSGSVATGTTSKGRWPANVMLSHTEECRLVGSDPIKGDNRKGKQGTRPAGFGNVGSGSGSGSGKPAGPLYGDGTREVWECSADCPVAILDAQTAVTKSAGGNSGVKGNKVYGKFNGRPKNADPGYGDVGSASRFYYVAKPRKNERHIGLADGRQNNHPTLKSLALLEYLCRLSATPTGGIVLDPFMGSGTGGISALLTGRRYIGMEITGEYFRLAAERLCWAESQPPEETHAALIRRGRSTARLARPRR